MVYGMDMTNTQHIHLGLRPMHEHCDWKSDTAPSGKVWLVCGRCGYRMSQNPRSAVEEQAA